MAEPIYTPEQEYKMKQLGIDPSQSVSRQMMVMQNTDPEKFQRTKAILGYSPTPADKIGSAFAGAVDKAGGALNNLLRPPTPKQQQEEPAPDAYDDQRSDNQKDADMARALEAREKQLAAQQSGPADTEQKEDESPEEYYKRMNALADKMAMQRLAGRPQQ